MVEYSNGMFNKNWLKFYFKNEQFRREVQQRFVIKNHKKKKQQLQVPNPIFERSHESSMSVSRSSIQSSLNSAKLRASL